MKDDYCVPTAYAIACGVTQIEDVEVDGTGAY